MWCSRCFPGHSPQDKRVAWYADSSAIGPQHAVTPPPTHHAVDAGAMHLKMSSHQMAVNRFIDWKERLCFIGICIEAAVGLNRVRGDRHLSPRRGIKPRDMTNAILHF